LVILFKSLIVHIVPYVHKGFKRIKEFLKLRSARIVFALQLFLASSTKQTKMKLKNRNGVLGLETAKAVMVTFLVLAVTGVAILLALTSLQNANIFTANSQADNDTDAIVGNISSGLVTFFGSTGTIFSILIVVVIILAISIIIWAVGRFGQQTEGTVNL
jgi:hypothetical protein